LTWSCVCFHRCSCVRVHFVPRIFPSVRLDPMHASGASRRAHANAHRGGATELATEPAAHAAGRATARARPRHGEPDIFLRRRSCDQGIRRFIFEASKRHRTISHMIRESEDVQPQTRRSKLQTCVKVSLSVHPPLRSILMLIIVFKSVSTAGGVEPGQEVTNIVLQRFFCIQLRKFIF
jgi:hypothetical protein